MIKPVRSNPALTGYIIPRLMINGVDVGELRLFNTLHDVAVPSRTVSLVMQLADELSAAIKNEPVWVLETVDADSSISSWFIVKRHADCTPTASRNFKLPVLHSGAGRISNSVVGMSALANILSLQLHRTNTEIQCWFKALASGPYPPAF